MTKAKRPLKSAAVLTLFRPDEYTDAGAKAIAEWLRKQARLITSAKQRKTLARRYTARFLY